LSICTWHSLHHTQTIDIAKRGVKAIICEKPMAIGSGPAKEMLDACNKNNVKLIISNEFVKKLSESNSLNEEEDLYFRYYSDIKHINDYFYLIDKLDP
jgi:hypothetical protein